MAEELMAQAEQDGKFEAMCDAVAELSDRHEAHKRIMFNDPQVRRLLERERLEDVPLPSTREELEAAQALMWKIHRATCPFSVTEQAREIVNALMPQKF